MYDESLHRGWGLRPVELEDQQTFGSYLSSLSTPLSDYTFSQIFTWRNSLRILWAKLEGHLCTFANGSRDLTLLLPPIGAGDSDKALRRAFELMDDYNAAQGVPDRSRVEYASEEMLARLDRSNLSIQPMGHDYIYDVQRMIDLAGGDLKSKRQERNRFTRDYAYRVETYESEKHLTSCQQVLESWKLHQDEQHLNENSVVAIKRQKESIATNLALQHARELGLRGIVVYVNDQIRAFTFGEALSATQSSIVIEKTDLSIKGLAQFIFSEFCRTYWSDRPLVNVGDDWGIKSLAWTKMSYRPVQLLPKFVLTRTAVTSVRPQPVAPIIRRATAADIPAVAEMENSCFSAYCLSKRRLRYLLKSESSAFFVAEHAGHVVGEGIALVRHHRRGATGRIYSLAVRAQSRGQRVGRRLLETMLSELSRRGVRRVYLEVEDSNSSAITLYEHAGFQRTGTLSDYYGPGRAAVHMMREIDVPVPAITPAAA
jgi:ribosomal protein S18 acetylase RimI-like enzyme